MALETPVAVLSLSESGPERRPKSASGGLTGPAGIVAALLTAWLIRDWLQPGWLKALVVVSAVAAAMMAVDLCVYRVQLASTTGLAGRPLRRLNRHRVTRKVIGLWATICAVAAVYWLLPEYALDSYEPFKQAACACVPAILLLSPFYIAWVDRRQHEPDDAYAQLGALIAGERPADWSALRAHALGWTIKAFFLPLMFGGVTVSLSAMWSRSLLPDVLDFNAVLDRLIDLFFLVDVLLASVAYTLTLRVLDTHVRSVEQTLGGWVVCLICYEPFVKGVGANYFLYDSDRLEWSAVFAPYPLVAVAWGTIILALVFVYAWSTVVFGLRFSNLTNRGIITSGPYRWTKHPAYLCKNLSWWMISVPFISADGWSHALQSCLLLCGANLVYVLRARTEERHLSLDPAYREYAAFIAKHGLLAVLRRHVPGGPARPKPAGSTRVPIA